MWLICDMRYIFFPFFLIILCIFLGFCTGCSHNNTHQAPLHDIDYISLDSQKHEKNTIDNEKNMLLDEKNNMLKTIKNIQFD